MSATDDPVTRGSDGASLRGGSWNIPSLLDSAPGLVALDDELQRLAKSDPSVVVTTPDLAYSNGLVGFRDSEPGRFFQMGVSEQNMVSVAAGMAASGLRPYVAAFSSFLALLCCEQIRT